MAGAHSPSRSTVLRLIKKFETTGSVKDEQRSVRPTFYKEEEFQAAVLREIDNNTPTSTRRIARQLTDRSDLHASHTTVFKNLIELKKRAYTPRLVHELNDDDPDRRFQACEIFQHIFEDDPTSVDRIMWSDETVFKLNGQINKYNCVLEFRKSPPHFATLSR